MPSYYHFENGNGRERQTHWSEKLERKHADTIGTVQVPWAGHF